MTSGPLGRQVQVSSVETLNIMSIYMYIISLDRTISF